MRASIFLCLLLSTTAAFGGELRDACIREQTLDAQLQAIWNRSKCDEGSRSPYLKDPLLSPCFDRKPRENPLYFWK
jgi:hypothetical protein